MPTNLTNNHLASYCQLKLHHALVCYEISDASHDCRIC